jgi:hypothetical protein
MSTPSFNSAIHYLSLAGVLGLQVNATKPPSALCPVCRLGTVHIHDDPRDGGFWWWCNHCDLACSSFQLYRQLKGLPSARAAWETFVREAALEIGTRLDCRRAEATQNLHDLRCEAFEDFWAACRSDLAKHPRSHAVTTLQRMALWGSYHAATWREGLGRYLGMADRLRIEKLSAFVKLGKARRGMADAVVMGYEYLPGKVGTWLFAKGTDGAEGVTVHKVAVHSAPKDAGILGLSAAIEWPRTLYAVTSPEVFLKLQKAHVHDTGKTGPFIACVDALGESPFTCTTGASWGSFGQDVIFWKPDPDIDLLNQARLLGQRGLIALHPTGEDQGCQDPLTCHTVGSLIRRLSSSAVHWMVFLKKQVLASSPADAVRWLEDLQPGLSDEEYSAFLAMCSPAERQRIQLLYSHDQTVQTFRFDGETLIARPGRGLYRLNQIRSRNDVIETHVSAAYYHLDGYTMIGSRAFLRGRVMVGEHQLPFHAAEDVIRNDPWGYMARVISRNEIKILPPVMPGYRDRLLDVAMAANPPETQVYSRIGWDQHTGCWEFPCVSVKGEGGQAGEVTGKPAAPEGHALPGMNLRGRLPEAAAVRRWAEAAVVTAPAMGLIAAITTNLLQRRERRRSVGVLALDQSGGATDLTVWLASLLNLQQFNKVGRMNPADAENLHQACQETDLPVHLVVRRVASEGWEGWARGYGPHNVLTCLGHAGAVSLGACSDWTCVRCGPLPAGYFAEIEGVEDLIVPTLAAAAVAPLGRPIDAVLTAMHVCLESTGETAAAAHLMGAVRERLFEAWRQETWQRFLGVLFHSVRSGQLLFDRDGFSRDDQGNVVLRWAPVERVIRPNGWFVPAVDILDASFAAAVHRGAAIRLSDDGWVIDSVLWEAEYACWLRNYIEMPHI